jgi:hypothetical protein
MVATCDLFGSCKIGGPQSACTTFLKECLPSTHRANHHEIEAAIAAFATTANADTSKQDRIPNAKSIGWAIYAAGFVIWLFGYLSVGHAPVFRWDTATPWWISSFAPNLEAELGLALTFTSMIRIYWRAARKRA